MDKKDDESTFKPMSANLEKNISRPLGSSSKPLGYVADENDSLIQKILKNELDNSLLKFANDLNWPIEFLQSELKLAGVEHKHAKDQLTDPDKAAFLTHLIRYYSDGLKPHFKLKPDTGPNKEVEKINILKEKISGHVSEKNNHKKLFLNFSNHNLTLLQRLITQYSGLSMDQINELWNRGKNDFKGDERQAIYIVYRNKNKKICKTEFLKPAESFVEKCPFCQAILSNSSEVCRACGTGFSKKPSLIFDSANADKVYDEDDND